MASQISLQDKRPQDRASMIRNGTDQRSLRANETAATEALRGRMGDIDQYNVKSHHQRELRHRQGGAVARGEERTSAPRRPPRRARTTPCCWSSATPTLREARDFNQAAQREARRAASSTICSRPAAGSPIACSPRRAWPTADPLADNEHRRRQGAEPPRCGEHRWSARVWMACEIAGPSHRDGPDCSARLDELAHVGGELLQIVLAHVHHVAGPRSSGTGCGRPWACRSATVNIPPRRRASRSHNSPDQRRS